MVVANHDLLILFDGAALDAADGDASHKLVIVDGGDQHLEGGVRVHIGSGDIIQNGVEQRLKISACRVGGVGSRALTPRAEQHGRVELVLGGIQIQQQLQHLVHNLVDALVGTVDLVDHYDHPVAQLQGLAQNKAGLGHGAFRRVHQQNNAVHHFQNAFHFAAEVRMARGVHNIDLRAFIMDGGVFGQDRDAAFPFQIVGIHHAVHHGLVFAVDTALLEHLIHQRRFAVVDVGNDSDISQIIANHCHIPPNVNF